MVYYPRVHILRSYYQLSRSKRLEKLSGLVSASESVSIPLEISAFLFRPRFRYRLRPRFLELSNFYCLPGPSRGISRGIRTFDVTIVNGTTGRHSACSKPGNKNWTKFKSMGTHFQGKTGIPVLPARVSGWSNPTGNRFVVYDTFAEKPLPVYLDHFIFIMTIGIDFSFSLGITIPVMEPVGSSYSLVPVDFYDNIGNIVAA